MFWGGDKRSDKDTADQSSYEVTFRPKGGFNKAGSFTEGSSDTEYERQGYITFEVICKNLTFSRTWGLKKAYDQEGSMTDLNTEILSGEGSMRPSRWGRFSLSFLGSRRTHTTLDVSLRKGEEKSVTIVPFKACNDLDSSWDEHFSVEILLDEKCFGELRQELRDNPTFVTVIRLELDRMRGLYTTWSPSISEGRVLKFLDRKEDVSNKNDMPADFHCVNLDFHSVNRSEKLPFRISVGQLNDGDDLDGQP